MVLVTVILFLTSIRSLQSWDITEGDQFDILESWGVTRVKRQEKILSKFPKMEKKGRPCDDIHKTKEAPFTAIILYKSSGRLLCMGSIVDNQHILTSKRCYEKTETNDLLVLVGCYKPWWARYSQVLKVKKIIRHEYVIALLRLKNKITFTTYVQPVKLPPSITKMEITFAKAFPPPYQVVGFYVDRYDVPGDYLDKSKRYEIKEDTLWNYDECKLNYTKLVLDSMKLFCTLGNATYCWGGWGSPVLQWKQDTYFLQVGVVVADNCTTDTTGPLLVARTDVVGDWIRGNSYQGHQPS